MYTVGKQIAIELIYGKCIIIRVHTRIYVYVGIHTMNETFNFVYGYGLTNIVRIDGGGACR